MDNISFNDIILSTVTVESKISNIQFKEIKFINDILGTIKENKYINKNVLRIGCNYGEYITDLYKELTKPKKKSNRGRKKKVKEVNTRKIQGNGKYFHSQITFTILDKNDDKRFYHLKLFTNGTIQIPFVCDENIYSISYIIEHVINIINYYDFIKIDKNVNIEIKYIKSIMRNYKFNIENESIFIDLNKFKKVILNFKEYVENDKYIDSNSEFYLSEIDTNLYDTYYEELTKLKLALVKHSSERYVGFILKFYTPTEDNDSKKSTIKIFSSGKFNIDGCNNRDDAIILQQILYRILIISKSFILYVKE